jgi:hypothetical protein
MLLQKVPGSRNSSSHTGLYHAQLVAPGAGGNASALLSSEWCQLLSRIGDELMLSLLLHCSIFSPLPGNNMLQLTGRPVSMVGRVCASGGGGPWWVGYCALGGVSMVGRVLRPWGGRSRRW